MTMLGVGARHLGLRLDLVERFGCVGLLFFGFIGLLVLVAVSDYFDKKAFDAMTPAQHLQAAKLCVAERRVNDAKRHLASIPVRSSEAIEATTISNDLEAGRAAAAEARQAKLRENEVQQSTIRGLEGQLRGLGYELTASQSTTPREIVIVSRDFADTDRRVNFLSQLRGNKSMGACVAGFRTVRLKNLGTFAGFDEKYSLECF